MVPRGSSLVPEGQALFPDVPTWFLEGQSGSRGSSLVPEGQAWFQEVPIGFPECPVWLPGSSLVPGSPNLVPRGVGPRESNLVPDFFLIGPRKFSAVRSRGTTKRICCNGQRKLWAFLEAANICQNVVPGKQW